MSQIAIKVENLSKIYRLGEIGTGTISRDMERWFKTRILKQEDPFLKIGETNDRANKGASDIVYSLQDINFEINQGDAVGIIGRNGAGKSTLLKILSRVTTPTTGKINIKGRVASLLEVGTGFHPELTGRENIYLNGAILGMRKREIDRKLDEIIDFSGVERYIDTPVKRYSSGMYVRLAFAVAAHLESEILIVDEVLAVGDAEFQKKCLGKMGEVSKGEGRTVLFVSHNLAAVQVLCGNGIFLQNGKLEFSGSIENAVQKYLSNNHFNSRTISFKDKKSQDKSIQLNSIKIVDENGNADNELTSSNEINVKINYIILKNIYNLRVSMCLINSDGVEILSTSDFNNQNDKKLRTPGKYESICTFPKNFFNLGNYRLRIDIDIPMEKPLLMDFTLEFKIENLSINFLGKINAIKPSGLIHPQLNWQINHGGY
jgi:lipopolysaccharide transport system ATP-binding protein